VKFTTLPDYCQPPADREGVAATETFRISPSRPRTSSVRLLNSGQP